MRTLSTTPFHRHFTSGYRWLMAAMAAFAVIVLAVMALAKQFDHGLAQHEAELLRHQRMEAGQPSERREAPNRQMVGGGPQVLQQ